MLTVEQGNKRKNEALEDNRLSFSALPLTQAFHLGNSGIVGAPHLNCAPYRQPSRCGPGRTVWPLEMRVDSPPVGSRWVNVSSPGASITPINALNGFTGASNLAATSAHLVSIRQIQEVMAVGWGLRYAAHCSPRAL